MHYKSSDEFVRHVAAAWLNARTVAAMVGPNGVRLGTREAGAEMRRWVAVAVYMLVMTSVIVGVDVAFFRNQFWERLMVNIGIVLVFAAFCFRFPRHL